jgi:hypothetical protein
MISRQIRRASRDVRIKYNRRIVSSTYLYNRWNMYRGDVAVGLNTDVNSLEYFRNTMAARGASSVPSVVEKQSRLDRRKSFGSSAGLDVSSRTESWQWEYRESREGRASTDSLWETEWRLMFAFYVLAWRLRGRNFRKYVTILWGVVRYNPIPVYASVLQGRRNPYIYF